MQGEQKINILSQLLVEYRKRGSGVRHYLSAAGAGLINRAIVTACRFLSVPLMLGLLDRERYGLWLLITSFLSWLGLADLGMPSALQSPLVGAVVRSDSESAERLLGYAWKRLLRNGILIAVCSIAMIALVPVAKIFGVSAAYQQEFSLAIAISAVVFGMGLPLRLGNIVAYAIRWAHVPPWADTAGQMASLAVLGMLALLRVQSLFAAIGSTVFVQFILSLSVFRYLMHVSGWTTYRRAGVATAKEKVSLRTRGGIFLLVVIGEGLVLQTDNFIIGRVSGPSAIAAYAIPLIFVMQFLQLQNVFLRPLWAIVAGAQARGNYARMQYILISGLGASVLAGAIFAVGLVALGEKFIHFWTQGRIAFPTELALSLASYIVALAPCNFLAIYCNAADLVRARLCGILSFGITKVPIAWWWLHHYGIATLPACFALLAVLTDLPVLIWASFTQLRRLKNHQGSLPMKEIVQCG